MNFMFEWQEQYLTSERSERVRCCSCHGFSFYYMETKILNISDFIVFQSSQVLQIRLGFIKKAGKKKGGNRDVIERYDTHKGDIRKIRHSGPG